MISSFLGRMRLFGAADALVGPGGTVGYDRLLALIDEWRQRFDREAVRPGDVVALEATYSPNACAALIALVQREAVVVPMSGLPAAKQAEFREIAQVELLVEIDPATDTHRCERTGRRAAHELYDRLRAESAAGLVLFSSGTSGRSKASVLDFRKLLKKYGEPRRPRRTLTFLNLDHIGGINTLLYTLSHGGAIVTVAERTPNAVFAAIAEHAVEVLPTTPTFLNMVLISGALERHPVESLKLITYGTEPMPARTLQKLHEALPGVRLKQTYGLSELGILPTKSRDDQSLWVKLGGEGFAHKIVDDVLWIKSDMAMLGYLNAAAPFDEDGYFNTQDVVETDGDYVHILGRRSELINVGGEKVYPSEVENLLLAFPGIVDVTVSGIPSPVTGMVVKATVRTSVPEDAKALGRRIRQYCRPRLEPFKVPVVVEIVDRDLHSDRMKKARSAS